MNYLKIASAALAAFVLLNAGDAGTVRAAESAAVRKATVKAAPRFSAGAQGALLLEPRELVKTAFDVYEKIKPSLSKRNRSEFDELVAFFKAYHVEDVAWVEAEMGSDGRFRGAFFYPHSVSAALEASIGGKKAPFKPMQVDGIGAFGIEEEDVFFAQVGQVVVTAASRQALLEQVKLYGPEGKSADSFAGLKPSVKGLLSAKVKNLGKSIDRMPTEFRAVVAMFGDPDIQRILKESGEFTAKVTTEDLTISLEAGTEADATSLKTMMDGLIMMAQTLIASQKEDHAESLPPEVKPHLPAIEAAVKSLSCRQNGKKVTLGMKVEIVKLAAAILPSVM